MFLYVFVCLCMFLFLFCFVCVCVCVCVARVCALRVWSVAHYAISPLRIIGYKNMQKGATSTSVHPMQLIVATDLSSTYSCTKPDRGYCATCAQYR